jgi:D-xylose transport system permease protein
MSKKEPAMAVTTVDSGGGATGPDGNNKPEKPNEDLMLGSIESDNRNWWERNRELFTFRSAGALYALISLIVFFIFFSEARGKPFYLSELNVANVLEQASLIGIMAIGMTVLLISGNFDLSVASNAAMSAMVTALAMDSMGPVPAVIIGILTGMAGGLFNGLVHWYVGLNSFIVTLGTLTAYRGMVLFLNNGEEKIISKENRDFMKSIAGDFFPRFELFHGLAVVALVAAAAFFWQRRTQLGIGALVATVVFAFVPQVFSFQLRLAQSVAYAAAILLVVWFVLTYTVIGRRLYATGGNKDAARAAGIQISRYVVTPFVLVGFCAGVAGVITLAKIGSVPPTVLLVRELDVIASAIIGGVALTGGSGNVLKTMLGAMLLFVLTNGFNYTGTSPFISEIAIGLLVIVSAAAYVLASRRAAEKGVA